MRFILFLLLIFICYIYSYPTIRSNHPPNSPLVEAYLDIFPPDFIIKLEEEIKFIVEYERSLPSLLNGKYRTRWFPKNNEPKLAIEIAIQHLRKIVKPSNNNIGAEWWVQHVPANKRGSIGWHVDKDESVASNKHYLSHPEIGSIYYLTEVGGCTVITDQWSPEGNGYMPNVAKHGYMSCPKKNKYITFHGELLHGVLGGDNDMPNDIYRTTFLVNWWDYKPEEPNCSYLIYEDVYPFGLKTLSKDEINHYKTILSNWTPAEEIISMDIPTLDMHKTTSLSSYIYNFNLPGGKKDSLRLPIRNDMKKHITDTYHLQWEKLVEDKNLNMENTYDSLKVKRKLKDEEILKIDL